MKSTTFLVLGLAVLVLATGQLAAATIYVDAAAAPGGNGSQASPFRTIQQGINAAFGGDTVIVAAATYAEHVDFAGKNITVCSTNPDDRNVVAATIVDGTNNGTVVTFDQAEGSAATLNGFTVRNGRADTTAASHGAGIHIENASPTILNNVITANYTKTDGGGIAVVKNSAPTIQGNTIASNTADGWGGGIFVYGDTSDPQNIRLAAPLIQRNRVTANSAAWDGGGIACFEACSAFLKNVLIDNNASGEVGGGLFIGYGVSAAVENCTLADNDALGSNVDDNGTPLARVGRGGGAAAWFSSSNVVYNSCILWGGTAKNNEGAQASLEGTSSVTFKFCSVQGEQPAIFKEAAATLIYQPTNQAFDPFFSPTPGDYHVQSMVGRYDPATGTWLRDPNMSPCIDAGDPALPFSLEPQPAGYGIEIGAYGNTPEASMSGVPFTILVSKDWDWVYQNAPIATGNRHKIVLTVTVSADENYNTNYFVNITKTGGPGDVTVCSTANPLVWRLRGSQVGVGGTGDCNLNVFVYGDIGGAANAATTATVRLIGDIDGNGTVTGADKLEMNKRLNGLPVGVPERALDLTGDGSVNGLDKLELNKVLNGIPIE